MILKIDDFAALLSILYLGLSIIVVLSYEWFRKDSYDPFSGIVLFSLYCFFELVFVPLVRFIAMSDHYEWRSWYGRVGLLDNEIIIYVTTLNVFAYWLFTIGYYLASSRRSPIRINDTHYPLQFRSNLWISTVITIAACVLVSVQVYWLIALGECLNIETIVRRAIFERAAVYNFDPSLSFVVSLMQILSGVVIIIIMAAFVPICLTSNNKIYKLNWVVAFCVVLAYGALTGYRLPVIWPLVTPFILLFYFGGFSLRKMKRITLWTVICSVFLVIFLSHLQSQIATSVMRGGEVSLNNFALEEQNNIMEFLNNTTKFVSRDTFAAIWGIVNYYGKDDTRLQGGTFLDAVLSLIPRRFWPDKKMVYGSDEVTFHMGLPLTTHTTIGIHGELFANFGYIGVIIMVFYGGVLGLLDKKKKEKEIILLVFAVYLGVARALVHFDFGFTALFISTYTAFFYFLAVRIIFYKRVGPNKFIRAIKAV